jgi:hypothetical protein
MGHIQLSPTVCLAAHGLAAHRLVEHGSASGGAGQWHRLIPVSRRSGAGGDGREERHRGTGKPFLGRGEERGSPTMALHGGMLGRRRADDGSGDRWSLVGLVGSWSTVARRWSLGWRKGAGSMTLGRCGGDSML